MFHDVELEGVGELSDASDRMGDSGQALGRFEADRGPESASARTGKGI